MSIDPIYSQNVLEYNNCIYFVYQDIYHEMNKNQSGIEVLWDYYLAKYDIENNIIELLFEFDSPGMYTKIYDRFFII